VKTARFIEDLSPLARRGALSQAESRRLDVYLNASEEARELHEIGTEYDQMRTERPGDDALLRRMSERVLERHARQPQTKTRVRWGRGVTWVAVGMLIASMAGASAWKYRAWGQSTAILVPMVPTAHVKPAVTRGSEGKPAAPGPSSTEPSPSMNAQHPPVGTRHAVSLGEPPAASSTPNRETEDARTLFSHANAERKSGDLHEALASYERLRQAYPASPEARLSSVLSARLDLRSGDATSALAHFERYLAAEPNGALAEEALQGKAQALGSLGRTAEEQEAWRLLLRRFPKSVQAQTARERLTP